MEEKEIRIMKIVKMSNLKLLSLKYLNKFNTTSMQHGIGSTPENVIHSRFEDYLFKRNDMPVADPFGLAMDLVFI